MSEKRPFRSSWVSEAFVTLLPHVHGERRIGPGDEEVLRYLAREEPAFDLEGGNAERCQSSIPNRRLTISAIRMSCTGLRKRTAQ
jgi:hypothetical protein